LEGYGAVLPQHTADKDMRLLATTSHSAYGGRDADDDAMRVNTASVNTRGMNPNNIPAAGLS
jgi:hypothetical protein